MLCVYGPLTMQYYNNSDVQTSGYGYSVVQLGPNPFSQLQANPKCSPKFKYKLFQFIYKKYTLQIGFFTWAMGTLLLLCSLSQTVAVALLDNINLVLSIFIHNSSHIHAQSIQYLFNVYVFLGKHQERKWTICNFRLVHNSLSLRFVVA